MTRLLRALAAAFALLLCAVPAAHAQLVGGQPLPVLSGPRDFAPGWPIALDFTGAKNGGVQTCKALGVITHTCASLLTTVRSSVAYGECRGQLIRFEVDQPVITCQGLAVWEQRTNLLSWSQAFDSALWAKTNATASLDETSAPDGTRTADSVVRTSTAASGYVTQSVAGPAAGTALTISAYAKAKSAGNQVGLRIQGTYPDRVDAVFDLASGTVRGAANGGVWTGATATIQPLANGWYRLTLTGLSATTALGQVVMGPTDSTRTVGSWEASSTVLSDAYLWGAQLEAGAFATSYIPTTTTAATRPADLVTLAHTPPAELTMVAQALRPESLGGTGVDRRVIGSDGAASIGPISIDASGKGETWNGAIALKTANTVSTPFAPFTVAAAWSTANSRRAVSLQGGAVASDAGGSGAWTYLALGQNANGGAQNSLDSYLQQFRLAPRLANDNELQSLSAGGF